MKRYIRSAEKPAPDSKSEDLDNNMSALKDDFNFVMDGIDKIAADGNVDKALDLARGLSEMINASIEEMAEAISIED